MKQYITLQVNSVPVKFEIDTGCPIVLIGEQHWKICDLRGLSKFSRKLYGATGHQLEIIGECSATLSYNDKSAKIQLIVQRGHRENPLFGITGLDAIFPTWRNQFISSISSLADNFLSKLKIEFKNIFDDNFTTPIKDFTINLRLKENSVPRFCKARTVPYAIRDEVESNLKSMVSKGILAEVKSSEWASPLVIVKKSDGKLRICMDPKRTLNPCLDEDCYPIPNIEDLLVEIGGHDLYSVIDLTGAFQQLKLSEESQSLVTVNTHIGLFKFLRLPFGIKIASAAFQRVIDEIIRRFKWARAYIDDIIVTARSVEEMVFRLQQLFGILQEYGAKVNFKKCKFFQKEVVFLGYVISKAGIFPSKEMVQNVISSHVPQNVKELQTMIGLLSYIQKFIPKLSDKLHPFYKLLRKDEKFVWSSSQQTAFEEIKKELANGKFLIHFDSRKQPILCTDASDVGIAGVLCHEIDGVLRPVSFKSRSLSTAEKRYPILHRELLAVVYAVDKYYKYIYGRKVILFTDHKPLVPIIKNGLAVATVDNRVHRYLFRLNSYDLEPFHKPGKLNILADYASRFPQSEPMSDEDRTEQYMAVKVNCVSDNQNVNLSRLRVETLKDRVLMKLKDELLTGFYGGMSADLKQFSPVSHLLEFSDGLLLVENRVVVPSDLREKVLEMLHEHHLGMVRSKQLARKYFYWPGMNNELEKLVRACKTCAEIDPDRLPKTFVPWPVPSKPFERVHLDFFDAFSRRFFLLVDAFSRWTEIFPMQKTDASHVLTILNKIFLTFGEPRLIVADNGPPFSSKEFGDFCSDLNIKLLNSPPYHPASNGICERWVQTAKNSFKKIMGGTYSDTKLSQVLKALRSSPATGDGIIPSHVIFSYRPRTKLEDCLPSSAGEERSVDADELPPYRQFAVGEHAWLLTKNGPRVRCVIIQKLGRVLYRAVAQGAERTVHANQLKKCAESTSETTIKSQVSYDRNSDATKVPTVTRPQRNRKPPIRYTN